MSATRVPRRPTLARMARMARMEPHECQFSSLWHSCSGTHGNIDHLKELEDKNTLFFIMSATSCERGGYVARMGKSPVTAQVPLPQCRHKKGLDGGTSLVAITRRQRSVCASSVNPAAMSRTGRKRQAPATIPATVAFSPFTCGWTKLLKDYGGAGRDRTDA
jgi:hypothetical protein